MALNVRTKVVDDVWIVGLDGPLTLGGGELQLRAAVRDLLAAARPRIVLDLSGVRTIDSAGMGEIVSCTKRARERGGDVVLLQPSPKVREVLEDDRPDPRAACVRGRGRHRVRDRRPSEVVEIKEL